MSLLTICPRCKNETKETGNRLITEICGHTKCRNCLLAEEAGCLECLQSHSAGKDNEKCANVEILESVIVPTENKTPNESQKKPKGKIRIFPEHITKEISGGNITIYKCKVCNKSFKSRSQQYYHLFCNDAQNKPYKCTECPQTFSSLSHLNYHIEEHNGQTFRCEFCQKEFSKFSILKKHRKLHDQTKNECKQCGSEFKDATAYKAHMDKHADIYPYFCDICNTKFNLKSTFVQHRQIHVNAPKEFECEFCSSKFQRKSSYKFHLSKHANCRQEFKCTNCVKEFTDKKTLDRHQQLHIGKFRYKCTLCDITTVRKDNLTRHIRNIHGGEQIPNSIEIVQDVIQLPSVEEGNTKESSATVTQEEFACRVSVIQSVGKPLSQHIAEIPISNTEEPPSLTPVPPRKKIKKKFDPFDIYRQILDVNDDDSVVESDDTKETFDKGNTELNTETKPSESLVYNPSNFTETHWRKNFKYTYQYQYK